MISIASTLPIILGSIVGCLGLYYIYIYSRMREERVYLTFAATCLAVAAYDFFCAGLYSSESVSESIVWQRLQLAALSLMGIAFIRFVFSYLSHKKPRIVPILYIYLAVSAIFQIVDRSDLSWKMHAPLIKKIVLPFGLETTYYEATPGYFSILQGVVGILIFVYLFRVSFSYYRRGLKKEAKPLLVSLTLFFVGFFNDVAVLSGWYEFIYMIEYTFMVIILMMAYSLTNQLMEAVTIKKELRESEEKHRTILETIEEAYFEVDLAGRILFCNEALCRFLKYSKNELLGTNSRQYMDEENAREVFKAYNTVYRTGEPIKIVDRQMIRKDGTICYIEASASLRIENGQPIGFQGIARDVTERKLAEREKAKLEHKLRQAQKLEALGTLAGGVAHDLNNVLSGIVGYPDLLLLQLPKDSPLRKPILSIQETGKKAAAIVQDLLALARRGVAAHEVMNLSDMVTEYLVSPEYKKMKSFYPDVDVHTDLDAHLLNMLGSPVHITKVIMNLVTNSAEAIGKKGRISISTNNRSLDDEINGYENVEPGDYVTLTVSDSGSGISSKDIERIFEPFYTKKKLGKSGTGLGMAVVWATVKDHKGYIDVTSLEGKGTTFTLYFPLTRQQPAQDLVDLSIDEYMGQGQSILVVDDMQEQRELVSQMLTTLGYAVAAVSSGEEAIGYLQTNPAELLVLDMIMKPGMDGLDTYRQVQKYHRGQKAIIASGYSETDRVLEAQRLGAGQYIKKPYTLKNIGLAVKQELEK